MEETTCSDLYSKEIKAFQQCVSKTAQSVETAFFIIPCHDWHLICNGDVFLSEWTHVFAAHIEAMYPLCPLAFQCHRFGKRCYLICEANCTVEGNYLK